mgnify:CR=1 FL=1
MLQKHHCIKNTHSFLFYLILHSKDYYKAKNLKRKKQQAVSSQKREKKNKKEKKGGGKGGGCGGGGGGGGWGWGDRARIRHPVGG